VIEAGDDEGLVLVTKDGDLSSEMINLPPTRRCLPESLLTKRAAAASEIISSAKSASSVSLTVSFVSSAIIASLWPQWQKVPKNLEITIKFAKKIACDLHKFG